MKRFLLTVGCLSFLTLPAVAQNNWRQRWTNQNAGNWARYDLNRDGRISQSELASFSNIAGLQGLDRNRNGTLEPRELRSVNPNQFIVRNNNNWNNNTVVYQSPFNANWAYLDTNRDNMINANEITAAGIEITPQLHSLDANRDGVLIPSELTHAQAPTYYGNSGANVVVPSTGYHWSNLDTNRNGRLESWELQQQGYNTNYNYNLANLDVNRDGYLDTYELNRAGYNPNTTYADPYSIDLNRDGVLSQYELQRGGYNASNPSMLDLTGDGRIGVEDILGLTQLLRLPGLFR
jgi:hypothetical protein